MILNTTEFDGHLTPMFKPCVGPDEVKDEVQIRHLVHLLKAEDESGGLGAWSGDLDEKAEQSIVSEEGWILGVR